MSNANMSKTLYSAKAHVFYLNPETNSSWLPKARQAIPVSFIASPVSKTSPQSKFHNPHTLSHELKLIGINERSELVLEDVITATTEFKKRSLKFCQWLDQHDNLMGLGFDEDEELDKFLKRFDELKADMFVPSAELQTMKRSPSISHAATQQASQDVRISANSGSIHASNQSHHNPNSRPESSNLLNPVAGQHSSTRHQQNLQNSQYQNDTIAPTMHHGNNGTSDAIHQNNGITSDQANGLASTSSSRYPRSQSMFALGKENNSNDAGKVSPDDADLSEQLRFDNEKLKLLNEKNKQNSAIWANELSILRTNNLKLTQALQESKSHVAGWERELMSLREENEGLKGRVAKLENEGEKELGYKKDMQEFKAYTDDLQRQLRDKEKEIESLQNSMRDMELNLNNDRNNNDDLSVDKHAVSIQQAQKLEQISAKFDAIIYQLHGANKDLTKIVNDITPPNE